jgi:uncharacterized protein (DUF2237 family)
MGNSSSSQQNILTKKHYRTNLNILGTDLEPCSVDPITGYTRTGSCEYNSTDYGSHYVCAIINNDFLNFTYSKGNDLISPRNGFPGLKKGDKWCICVFRWIEAYNYDPYIAPKIIPESTNMETLKYVPMRILKKYFI